MSDFKRLYSVAGGVPNFALSDLDGSIHELYREGGATGILLLSTDIECNKKDPRDLFSRLENFKRRYETLGIKIFLINATQTKDELLRWRKHYLMSVPILQDPSTKVTQELGLKFANEAILVNPVTWKPVFHGVLSLEDKDSFAKLSQAIDRLTKKEPDATTEVKGLGCKLKLDKYPEDVTFKTAAHIVAAKCLPCHVTQDPKFGDAESLVHWKKVIKDEVLSGRMPLWGYDSSVNSYADDVSLAPKEFHDLITWIDAGAPRDPKAPDELKIAYEKLVAENAKAPADPESTFSVHFKQPITVPPEGFRHYQYYQLGPMIDKDHYVSSVDVHSNHIAAIHHIMLRIEPHPLKYYRAQAEMIRQKALGSASKQPSDGPVWLAQEMVRDEYGQRANRTGVYSLGRSTTRTWRPFKDLNSALFIPQGSFLILEVHYHGIGRKVEDMIEMTFHEAKGDPRQIKKYWAYNVTTSNVKIPADTRDFTVPSDYTLIDKDIYAMGATTHMHRRGQSQKMIAYYPDGKEETLYFLNNYNYYWHLGSFLIFKSKKFLPKGTYLKTICTYDNSAGNPFINNSRSELTWGESLDTQEMCDAYLSYVDAGKTANN